MLFIKHRIKFLGPLLYKVTSVWRWSDRRIRFATLFIVGAILMSNIAASLNPLFVQHAYALGGAGKLLMDTDPTLADDLKFDTNKEMYTFDTSGAASDPQNQITGAAGSSTTPSVSATAYTDASKGISVTDNTNKVSFTMTPQFKLAAGQRDSNRLVPFVADEQTFGFLPDNKSYAFVQASLR